MAPHRFSPAALLLSGFVWAGCGDESASTPTAPYLHSWGGADPVVLTGVGTATVDGAFSDGEWAGAGTVTIAANLPASEGGGTTPVTLYVMNDLDNLYLGVVIQRTTVLGGAISTAFEFDNDHGGWGFGEGDDVLVANVNPWVPTGASFFDDVRSSAPPCPEGSMCGLFDVDSDGTSDGAAAATWDETHTFMEIRHPLDSDDDAHDFSVAAGDVIGVAFFVRFIAPGGSWPDGFGDTDFPFGFGDIVIAQLPPGMLVDRLMTDVSGYPALTATLQGAKRAIQENGPAAATLLEAFIRQVDAMVRSGRLTEEEGDELVRLARAALSGLVT